MKTPVTVAVTGLNATDNPGPGVAVVRALHADPDLDVRIVGLAYDSLEPGIYATDLVHDVFMIPYPTSGAAVLEERLRYIHEKVPLDVVLPTLDAELPGFISLADTFAELGIGTLLPSKHQFDLRSKARLSELAGPLDIPVPKTRTIADSGQLHTIEDHMQYPLFVKGAYYGARIAFGLDEAIAAFHDVVARWGLPVLVQERVEGEEVDVVALGDGAGGLLGLVAMKKTFLTDKGKGWAGIAIRDPVLSEITERFMAATKWRGPCELELMRDEQGTYRLIEINPRFPAWVYLSVGAGLNLPARAVRLAAGLPVSRDPDYRVGTMFVRISIDQIADLSDFEKLVTAGELTRIEE